MAETWFLQVPENRRARGAITESEKLAKAVAAAAAEKKAVDTVVLDMREVCSFTDFFVIMGGRSSRQTRAIAEEIRLRIKEQSAVPLSIEGELEGEWVLMDYLGVIVHIFTPEARDFYRLETLWKDAPKVEAAAK